MDQTATDSKRLHGHQILQHTRRIARLCAAPRSVVNEERVHRHQPLLLIDHQRAARPDVLHVGERLAGNLLFAGHHAEFELRAPLFGVRVGKLRAGHHALEAYTWAWADGEPYVHRYELNKARALLEKPGAEIPNLPPYDPAKDEKLPWEDDVAAAIEKLRAKKEAEDNEPSEPDAK